MFQRPSSTEWTPRFEMCILHSPLCECVTRPVVGALGVGRRGQARPDHITQVRERLHHLRAIHALVLDLGDDRILGWWLWLLPKGSVWNCQCQQQKRGGDLASKHLGKLLFGKLDWKSSLA